jgi:hypoxanthine phosphoribosyltransferase
VLVPVLSGALYFAADLSRALNAPHIVEPVRVRSYVGTTKATMRVDLGIQAELKPNDVVVIVDDIVDTGETLSVVVQHVACWKVRAVKAVALLKRKAFKRAHSDVLATGLEVDNEFVVGYGLDLDGDLRHLDYVARGVDRLRFKAHGR